LKEIKVVNNMSVYSESHIKLCSNWMINELMPALKRAGLDISQSPISSQTLSHLIRRIEDKTITHKQARQIFQELFNNPSLTVDEVICQDSLVEITSLVQEKLNIGNTIQ